MPQAQGPQGPQEVPQEQPQESPQEGARNPWFRLYCCQCSTSAVVSMSEGELADHAWATGPTGTLEPLVYGEEDASRYGRSQVQFFRRRGRHFLAGVQVAASDRTFDLMRHPSFSERRQSGWVCEDCLTHCERCGGSEDIADLCRVQINSSGNTEPWCPECRDNYAAQCDSCVALADCALLDDTEDGLVCSACRTRQLREMAGDAPSVILPYHSDFRRSRSRILESDWTRATGWHIGVELEVERGSRRRSREELAAELQAAANGDGRRLWAEADGSLTDGFELISEPMGLDMHQQLWPAVLASAAVQHLRSHQTSTCGLHVHISRRGLSRHQLARVNRLLGMQESEVFFRALARRWGSSYGCAKRSGFSGERELVPLSVPGGRYEALNLTGSRTVEFRLWRGSLLPQAVLASIEASVAMLRYARAATMAEVSVAGFLSHIHRPEHAAETKHLRPYVRRRLQAAVQSPQSREESAVLGRWLAQLPASRAVAAAASDEQ